MITWSREYVSCCILEIGRTPSDQNLHWGANSTCFHTRSPTNLNKPDAHNALYFSAASAGTTCTVAPGKSFKTDLFMLSSSSAFIILVVLDQNLLDVKPIPIFSDLQSIPKNFAQDRLVSARSSCDNLHVQCDVDCAQKQSSHKKKSKDLLMHGWSRWPSCASSINKLYSSM